MESIEGLKVALSTLAMSQVDVLMVRKGNSHLIKVSFRHSKLETEIKLMIRDQSPDIA